MMQFILKNFFCSIVLVTLFWVSQVPPESVTIAGWAGLVQSSPAQNATLVLTAILAALELLGVPSWPHRSYKSGGSANRPSALAGTTRSKL